MGSRRRTGGVAVAERCVPAGVWRRDGLALCVALADSAPWEPRADPCPNNAPPVSLRTDKVSMATENCTLRGDTSRAERTFSR